MTVRFWAELLLLLMLLELLLQRAIEVAVVLLRPRLEWSGPPSAMLLVLVLALLVAVALLPRRRVGW